MLKECKIHGVTEHVPRDGGYLRCKKCRSEAVSKARRKRKRKLISELGGKCQRCGYDKCPAALQFHHIKPADKEFGISDKGLCRSAETMTAEAKKCLLLCANCHAELHYSDEV